MKKLICAVLVTVLFAAFTPANAGKKIIRFDMGGVVVNYIKTYVDFRDTSDKLVIDGYCVSACTLFLGILNPDRYCMTKDAVLGFHSASTGIPGGELRHAPEFTQLMWNMYPRSIREALLKRGWNGGDAANNAHPQLILLSFEDLQGLIPSCR